jgi:pSer/pThr/pTyr-binding forkhead associated (FHA) protein
MISRIVGADNFSPDDLESKLLPASSEVSRSGREAMDEFLDSCGAGGPLRIDVTGPGPRQSVRCVFEQPCVMIGRDPGNDLRLDHDQVSRRHAYLQILGGRIFCIDLGSRTGLWWGKRTRTAAWLDAPVHIGPYRLQLPDRLAAGLREGLDWNPLETPAADQRVLPQVTLQVFDGGRPTLHTLDRVLTLAGRSTACKVQIANFSLSRYHCSFLLTATGVWVIDLLSREGTIVNGQRVKWACLRPGDQLELGRVLVCPHYEGDVPEGPTTMARPADDRFTSPPASDPELPVVSETYLPEEENGGRTLVAAPSAPQFPAAPNLDLKALEAAGPQGALLVPVLQQFSLMQQQMMDQFQQSMQMVVQVFASMHRDQMGMLQQELDHIHRITRELNELQAEVRAAKANPAEPRNGSHGRAAISPPAAQHVPAAQPAAPANQPQPKAESAAGTAAKATRETTATSPKASDMPNMGDMHDWLNQRIVSLQREREGRWQKILSFVMGK